MSGILCAALAKLAMVNHAHFRGRFSPLLLIVLLLPAPVLSQCTDGQRGQAADPVTTFFPHSQTSRWWISGQDNVIFQAHPSFPALYSAPNSFRNTSENATSNVAT